MKLELRSWLEDNAGLDKEATDQEAWKSYRTLDGEKRTQAIAVRNGEEIETETESTRTEETDDNELTVPQERQRVADIRNLFDGDYPELQRTAEDEGWMPDVASQELLAAIRRDRSESAGASPAIHSRSQSELMNLEALQGAMLLRSDVALDSENFQTREAIGLGIPKWLRSDINSDQRQQAMEQAHQIGGCSLVDMCRHSLVAAGKQVPLNTDEMIRSAFDEGTLTPLFTTNFNSMLLGGYMDAPDTTRAWTSEEDFGNFLQNDLVSMGKFGPLKRHARKVAADQMDVGATSEPIQLARYDGQYCVDEIDIINDRFGGIQQVAPSDMGMSAAQLRPDIVYAILLANGNLTRDDAALFLDGFNDYTGAGSAMSIDAIKQLVAGQAAVRQRNRPLNLKTKFLLVPTALMFDSVENTDSTEAHTGAGTTREPFLNQVSRLGLQTITESRLDAAGVVDPRDDTVVAGVDTQFFGVAQPGMAGAKTITVGYRRGTNRAPVVRAYALDKGQWGIGWDINMDVTAAPADRIAMARSGSSIA